MNIFWREVKSSFRSLIVWGVIVVLFVTIGFSKFAAYEGNPELLAVLDNMPPALMEAFNMAAFNLTTLEGFFGVMFTYFALLLSVAAAMWGSDTISKEERDKTVEFSLTLPVTRSRVVTTKALAALVNCIGLLLITWVAALVASMQYNPSPEFLSFLSLSMGALFLMQLIYLAVGLLLGCAMKRYKLAGAVAVSVIMGTYFLSIFSGLHEKLDFLKYFSPFRYFDPGMLLRESQMDLVFVGLSLAIVVVSLVGAYVTYARRDLYI